MDTCSSKAFFLIILQQSVQLIWMCQQKERSIFLHKNICFYVEEHKRSYQACPRKSKVAAIKAWPKLFLCFTCVTELQTDPHAITLTFLTIRADTDGLYHVFPELSVFTGWDHGTSTCVWWYSCQNERFSQCMFRSPYLCFKLHFLPSKFNRIIKK